MIHLVLGGARSGKSRYGESLVKGFALKGAKAIYLATATAKDEEMASRIAKHQLQRQETNIDWQLVEEPLALTAKLKALAAPDSVILVDCLTLWLTNQLLAQDDEEPASTESDFALDFARSSKRTSPIEALHRAKTEFLAALSELDGEVILVSNEVGSGIVPLGELSRQFVDEAGWLNQAIAELADSVTLVVAGLPLTLK
ncbi:bifunctional adenosylcobinamide kinase/adenosylcobinamide-phosphate guanylyltransferase [Shewanella acanthi]|uniref:bifunctional adenosylcobinamide kinase/adenosylcobinamide-phosphate guanylyltransferase n=1 Tax=Shewanella acanthi TaxID=2864212 RepID=UPI001C659DB1|nr:bifunctional adenosylcobinamide kinase/adenosylcobinamide-phosphate guanylyltransferase [Shewanella acanthi]QYJ78180.1 bifunctional adenosylcobinamide kinase/adenosylcobinamide-phosphate guanylyltransferase [Shewanella acanthi]